MRETAVRHLFHLLFLLYPRGFRDDIGADLVATAVDRWRDARQRGGVAEALFWVRDGARFALDGVLERLRATTFGAMAETRHAWRQVRRVPRHYGLAILTLALGVGATTTIFTVADAVVFRPLPYPHADELYLVHTRFGAMELSSNSLPNITDLRDRLTSFTWLAGAAHRSPALSDDVASAAERIAVIDVTTEYLPGLGARVGLGRGIDTGDHRSDAARVVIIADALWRRRWGADPGVIGRTLHLDDVPHTIIGVMDRSFRDPEPLGSGASISAWVPARGAGVYQHRDHYAFRVIGRHDAAASLDVARAQLAAAGAALSAAHPAENRIDDATMDFALHPLHAATVGDARGRMLLLLGAVVLLLLLSCANVANLFLARAVARRGELAVRAALGASSLRLGTQLFVESLLTAAAASGVGALLAFYGVRAFVAAAPPGIPRLDAAAPDVRVLGFVILLTALTAVIFGSVPAVRGAAMGRHAISSWRTTAAPQPQRFQSILLGAEVALALALLTGSALLLNSFRHMLQVEPGFDATDVAVIEVRPPGTASTHQLTVAFYDELALRLAALPGVRRSALLHSVPGEAGGAWSRISTRLPDGPQQLRRSTAPATGGDPGADFVRMNPVRGAALELLGVGLLHGRWFDGDPGDSDPRVVIINEAAARLLFPGERDVVGRQLALGSAAAFAAMREIVAVVADVRQRGIAPAPDPQVYLPYGQRDIDRMTVLLKLAPGATLDRDAVRRAVHDVAPNLPVDDVALLSSRYSAVADAPRFLALLLTIFAALGLVLAMVGTYATASQAMARRIRELGVRIVLGANARDVFRLVLLRALRTVAAGIAAGLLISLALVRFVESYVFGISARDPLTFATAAAIIATTAIGASLAPAIRAARIDPNAVLRSD